MSAAVALATFGIVFPAELPDKTALASLVLGTRYRPMYVFTGVAAAFVLHVVFAVSMGSLLVLLPHRVLQAVVGALFVGCAVLLLRGRRGTAAEEPSLSARAPTFRLVAWVSFAAILVAEFGDLTQIVTADLAARYRDPVSVGIGSVLALWCVAGLAILGGRTLLRVLSVVWITRIAGLAMVIIGAVSLSAAIRG